MGLFVKFKLDIVEVGSKALIFVLSPGQNYITINILDFDSGSVIASDVLKSPNGSGILEMKFEHGLKIDQKRYDAKQQTIIGYLYCDGTEFFEYELTLDSELTKLVEKNLVQKYTKPLTENFSVDKIVIGSQHFMLCGDFGKMTVSRQAWDENQLLPALPKKRALQEKTDQFDLNKFFSWFKRDETKKWIKAYNNQGHQRQIHQLIYKRDSPDVYMRGYGSDRFSTLEHVIGLGEYYVTTEVNSLKIFRIQPLTITEFKGTDAQLKDDPHATKTPLRKEPFELKPYLLVYSTNQLNTLEVFLKLQDSEGGQFSYVFIIFIAFALVTFAYIFQKWRNFEQAKKLKRKRKIAHDLNKNETGTTIPRISKELNSLRIVTQKLLHNVKDSERKKRLTSLIQEEGDQCVDKLRSSNSIDPFVFLRDAEEANLELEKKELQDLIILREFFGEKFEEIDSKEQDRTSSTMSGFRKRFSMMQKNTHKRSIQAVINAHKLIEESKKNAAALKVDTDAQKENLLSVSDSDDDDDLSFLQKPGDETGSDDEVLNNSGVFSSGDSGGDDSDNDSYLGQKGKNN